VTEGGEAGGMGGCRFLEQDRFRWNHIASNATLGLESPSASIRNDLALVRRRTATLRIAQRSENFEALEGALQAAASAL